MLAQMPTSRTNAAAAPPPASAVTIELGRQVMGHNGPINAVHLREPTIGDWIDCGALTRRVAFDSADGERKIEFIEDAAAVMRWMVRLSGLPEAVIRQLNMKEGSAVAAEIFRMIADVQSGNSQSAPTS